MQSIVRYDYYPNRPAALPRPISPANRLHTVEALSDGRSAHSDWAATSASAITSAEPRRLDVFRLVAAVAGLTVYLALPIAALVYIAFDLLN